MEAAAVTDAQRMVTGAAAAPYAGGLGRDREDSSAPISNADAMTSSQLSKCVSTWYECVNGVTGVIDNVLRVHFMCGQV